jgi:hypothetical protein
MLNSYEGIVSFSLSYLRNEYLFKICDIEIFILIYIEKAED